MMLVFSFHLDLFGSKWAIHVAEIVVLAAAAAVYAVKQLDLGVYHRMLRGAVTFGEDLEARHLLTMLDVSKGMTQAISHYSRFKDASRKFVDERAVYEGTKFKSAADKISRFYSIVIIFLLLSAALMFFVDNFSR